MPAKYVIHTTTVPRRFKGITRSGIIAWEEGCLKCAVCVKKKCVYGVYDHRGINARQMVESIDNECMNCLRCVQGCPNELIHKSLNPEFLAMGDEHWSPNIIASLWAQADAGKIPVSGAGYPGPFSGPGFDAIWTDMSEIVRPTRDGIHGREYISTAIDLGKTPGYLTFDEKGNLSGKLSGLRDIPLPILLRVPSFGAIGDGTIAGWAEAAKTLGTLFCAPEKMLAAHQSDYAPWLMPSILESKNMEALSQNPMIEIGNEQEWRQLVKKAADLMPSSLISVRLPLKNDAAEEALEMAESGISVIHLASDDQGRALDGSGIFLKDGIRSVHTKLVEAGIRDNLTLLASGGISMAEHVAKAIICGADGVYVDFPLLIALECRMCGRCKEGLSCPVDIPDAAASWITGRVINLLGAWHNQLLEVMGAMGIRDARRLRGEVGRAMFFEQLDRETFEGMGTLTEDCEIE